MTFGIYSFLLGVLFQVWPWLQVCAIKKRSIVKKIIWALFFKKLLLLFIVAALLNQQRLAHAQAVPVASFLINRTVSGVLTKVAIKRGFAANDPRLLATLTGSSSAITALDVVGAGAGVALTIAGAPVWLTIAAGLGIFGLGAYLSAGTAKLELTSTQLKYSPAVTSVPTYPGGGAALIPMDLHWQPQGYWEAYQRTPTKLYRGPACFSTQKCAQLPVMPSEYDPMIRVYVAKDMIYGGDEFGLGDFIAVFDSLADFKNNFVLMPFLARPGGDKSKGYPTTSGVSSVDVWENALSDPIDVNSAWVPVKKFWTDFVWTMEPVFDRANDGTWRIYGEYSSKYNCLETAFGLSNFMFCDSSTVFLYGATRYNFFSDEPWLTDPRLSHTTIRVQVSPTSTPADYVSADDLNAKLSDAQRAQKLSPVVLASLANAVWQKAAAMPGYTGLPYSVSQPVTEVEVKEYLSTNPNPTVGDLLTSAEDSTGIVPIIDTGTGGTGGSTAPAKLTDVNVVNTPFVNILNKLGFDWGLDTGQGVPSLENSPSLVGVFQPLIDASKTAFGFRVQAHGSVCPAPTMDFYGQRLVLDGHCALVSEYASYISWTMYFVYVVTAFFIVMSA